MKDDFDTEGKNPKDRERLKMKVSGPIKKGLKFLMNDADTLSSSLL